MHIDLESNLLALTLTDYDFKLKARFNIAQARIKVH